MQPLVGVTADRALNGAHQSHSAGEKYLTAVSAGAGCMPIIFPALNDETAIANMLERVDGVLLTGGYSNIEPQHYGQQPALGEDSRDAERDKTNLALIPKIIQAGIPVLGICRGLQELNVVMGGTLHQRVHNIEGMLDHREDKTTPVEQQYGLAHSVSLQAGGVLASFYQDPKPMVNSVHGQGIDRLGDGLTVEAVSEDGLVEAVSVTAAQQFALAVQWHPEWQVRNNKFYLAIFEAFGYACRAYAHGRQPASLK
ncbi:MAG: gamma-glutamyl-gamma-aminobutyrate hydrolase family protein [Porticoccaceae bacterium]|nr:gamma-glutamyl-gamma-aminobutyrate hydrolase family protein [Porticoccaceae bacterium]